MLFSLEHISTQIGLISNIQWPHVARKSCVRLCGYCSLENKWSGWKDILTIMPAANTQYFNLLLLFFSSHVCCCAWNCTLCSGLPSTSWLIWLCGWFEGQGPPGKRSVWESPQASSWPWLCCSYLTLWKPLKLYGHLFLICKMQELKYMVFILLKFLFWTCVNLNPSPKVPAPRN